MAALQPSRQKNPARRSNGPRPAARVRCSTRFVGQFHAALPGALHASLRRLRRSAAAGHVPRFLRVSFASGRPICWRNSSGAAATGCKTNCRRWPAAVTADHVARVKCDYRETLSDIMVERFMPAVDRLVARAGFPHPLPGPRIAGQSAGSLRPGRHPGDGDVPHRPQHAGLEIRLLGRACGGQNADRQPRRAPGSRSTSPRRWPT